ncbi:MAG: CoB--CoM heterodisulfide reductase iron-sulfur subunit B family protein [Prevotellaceae bacterium]|jgi:heterodisulfide reductase subunit B|nr:CoB--CoM heterodisulfide reductase iron-sulfur subunit B family protein [Prevotellaceae bacterium]
MIKIGFYPGCSLTGSSREYAESVIALCEAFNIELKQIPDWNCCGATAAHNLDKELSLALPARILALAEQNGMTEIVVPCAACYNRLSVTEHTLNADEQLRARISEIIEMPYEGTVKILNVIQMLQKYVVNELANKIVAPFDHKVACYYGCLLVRPHEILQFDRVEDPQTIDEMLKLVGAQPVDWAFKTECCGAGFSVSQPDIVGKLSGKIVKDAVDRGAEAMVVACPMCHANLDMRRPAINSYLKTTIDIPVLYVTQVLGLALGISREKLGLQRHFVPVKF